MKCSIIYEVVLWMLFWMHWSHARGALRDVVWTRRAALTVRWSISCLLGGLPLWDWVWFDFLRDKKRRLRRELALRKRLCIASLKGIFPCHLTLNDADRKERGILNWGKGDFVFEKGLCCHWKSPFLIKNMVPFSLEYGTILPVNMLPYSLSIWYHILHQKG